MTDVDHELREMHRTVSGVDGLHRLLRRLEQWVNGRVAILDQTGTFIATASTCHLDLPDDVAAGLRRIADGQYRSLTIDRPQSWTHLAAIDSGTHAPVLLVNSNENETDHNYLIAKAVPLLRLRWRADEAERRADELRAAEALIREAVLHLLMLGHVGGARRVGNTLGPPLPDNVQVYIVEGEAANREQLASSYSSTLDRDIWIIKCPIYRRHLIMLAPAIDRTREPVDRQDLVQQSLRCADHGVAVGASTAVAVRDFARGYEEAYHALAVARTRPEKYFQLMGKTDLVSLLDSAAVVWAREAMAPLLTFRPARPQDPDGPELLETLASWLSFYSGAARQLKIHRNTLSNRVRHISELLGRDLSELPVQAELDLALKLLRRHEVLPAATVVPQLWDLILGDHMVWEWCNTILRPLLDLENQGLYSTLGVWLDSNTRLEAAANRLGLSLPAVRKRLVRVEQVLNLSLLSAPSARFDLFFAMTVRKSRVLASKPRPQLVGKHV